MLSRRSRESSTYLSLLSIVNDLVNVRNLETVVGIVVPLHEILWQVLSNFCVLEFKQLGMNKMICKVPCMVPQTYTHLVHLKSSNVVGQ